MGEPGEAWPEDDKIAKELMAKSKQAAADSLAEAKEAAVSNDSERVPAAQSSKHDTGVMQEPPNGIRRVACAGLDDLSVPFILSQMPSFGWDCMCVPNAKLVIAMQNGAVVATDKSDHLTMIIKLQHALEKSLEEIAEDSGRPTLVLCPCPISTIADASTLRRILGKQVAARAYDAEISFDDVLPAPSIAGDTATPREYGAMADLQRIVQVGNGLAGKQPVAVTFKIDTSTKVQFTAPDALWEVMGNFADACIKFENVPAAKCHCVGGNQIGAVRTLSQIPGLIFTEELLVRDDMTISYNIQNTQGDSMMNCKDLVALYRIVADGEGSRVDWSVEGTFLGPLEGIPSDGKPPWTTLEGLTAHIKQQYPKNVKKAAALCNLPKIEVRLEENHKEGAGEVVEEGTGEVVEEGAGEVVEKDAGEEAKRDNGNVEANAVPAEPEADEPPGDPKAEESSTEDPVVDPEAEEPTPDGPGPQDTTNATMED